MASYGNVDDEEMSEINMTPLVDVMLVLLIIFMITVPVITHSVKVDLPQASQKPTEIKPDIVTLTVQQDGTTLWNDQLIDGNELNARLQAAAQLESEPELRIQADRKVEYEKVVQVMAAAQRAGLEKLGFLTQPVGEPSGN